MKNTELKKVDFESLEAVTGGSGAIRVIDPSKDGRGNSLSQLVVPAAPSARPGSLFEADGPHYEAFQRVIKRS